MKTLLSSGFQEGVTESYHLVNALRVSTQLLTDVVQKVIRAGADDKVIEALYSMPEGATGQHLRAFTSQSSLEREHSLSALWLFTVIGRYEVWADELPVLNSSRGCQFPSSGATPISTGVGYAEVFSGLASMPLLDTAFASTVNGDPRHLGARMDDALALYRLYKECRNSLAHAGGEASDLVERWGIEARARAADLHTDRLGNPFPIPHFGAGDSVTLKFEHVRTLIMLLLRMTFTIDASVLTSTIGDEEIVRRWRRSMGGKPVNVTRTKLERGKWLSAKLGALSIPAPNNDRDIVPYLKDRNLIRELL